jgi:hypothetical protein
MCGWARVPFAAANHRLEQVSAPSVLAEPPPYPAPSRHFPPDRLALPIRAESGLLGERKVAFARRGIARQQKQKKPIAGLSGVQRGAWTFPPERERQPLREPGIRPESRTDVRSFRGRGRGDPAAALAARPLRHAGGRRGRSASPSRLRHGSARGCRAARAHDHARRAAPKRSRSRPSAARARLARAARPARPLRTRRAAARERPTP